MKKIIYFKIEDCRPWEAWYNFTKYNFTIHNKKNSHEGWCLIFRFSSFKEYGKWNLNSKSVGLDSNLYTCHPIVFNLYK